MITLRQCEREGCFFRSSMWLPYLYSPPSTVATQPKSCSPCGWGVRAQEERGLFSHTGLSLVQELSRLSCVCFKDFVIPFPPPAGKLCNVVHYLVSSVKTPPACPCSTVSVSVGRMSRALQHMLRKEYCLWAAPVRVFECKTEKMFNIWSLLCCRDI